jgi:hypothetical protein
MGAKATVSAGGARQEKAPLFWLWNFILEERRFVA